MSESDKNSNMFLKKGPVTIAGIVFLTFICSALYDFLVKPGINIFSESIFHFLTFGSQRAKDFSFNTAALDPTSMPSLMLLTALAVVVTMNPINSIIRRFFNRKKSDFESRSTSVPEIRKNLFWAKMKLLLLMIFLLAWVFVPLTIYNQSILIWRVFNANITIITPITTPEKISKLRAKYSSMTTESDYLKLQKEMELIAEPKGVRLREEKIW